MCFQPANTSRRTLILLTKKYFFCEDMEVHKINLPSYSVITRMNFYNILARMMMMICLFYRPTDQKAKELTQKYYYSCSHTWLYATSYLYSHINVKEANESNETTYHPYSGNESNDK